MTTELITVRGDGAEKTVSFSHRHINDVSSAHKIAGHLGDLIDQCGTSEHDAFETLKLDFGRVDRLTSVALNQLISVNLQAKNRGIRLVLTNVQEGVRNVFAVTRLERMFEVKLASGTSDEGTPHH